MEFHLTTERLNLDILTKEDHAFIRALVNTKGWLAFIGDRKVHTTEDAVAYINRILQHPQIFYWVVREKETNTPTGIISFLKRNYLEHFDIGFAFLPEYHGKGYAYEAAAAVMQMISALPGYYPVLATTVPENTSSIKLLNKLGLHFDRAIEADNTALHVYSMHTAEKSM